ncbi:MAG TPA: hypothetical protein QGF58_23665 [Myxococcota bacterium]|nr:hypothetical protein [Myxococcota bacterium]
MRKRRTATERKAMARAWMASGQTQRAFAEAAGVRCGSLQRWIKEARADEATPVGFVEVISPAGPEVVVVVPSGVRVELRRGFVAEEVGRLVAALC